MAILKKDYELSAWDETLGENGQKIEKKMVIIGAHDMEYLGRATKIKLKKELKGTQTLSFQLPSKFFDNELGDYVHNEFCDYLFNERKLKLFHDGKWYEFYIKNISEVQQFKSLMYSYTCQDAFIDELSRNGYGITFDTELYNNVEEIGVFSEEILDGSIWEYDASKNIGDFTEYNTEKLYKIPVSFFGQLMAYKMNYEVPAAGTVTNPYTKEERTIEMGDDIARVKKCFWDNYSSDEGIPLLSNPVSVANDGYIYVPYSQLGFCYIKQAGAATATEEPFIYNNSYALAPQSIDPNTLIQFIAIPSGAEVEIDESGLLLNKNYSYVMTLAQWNENVQSGVLYNVEDKCLGTGNQVVSYDGYLDSINDVSITFGKSIKISDRTEINISEDIDQYVTVYNNQSLEYSANGEYEDLYTSEDWVGGVADYRVCSYEATRIITPQLARNLVQNGTSITKDSGWEVMRTVSDINANSSSIEIELDTENENTGYLKLVSTSYSNAEETAEENEGYYSFLNFGIVGQEQAIQKEKTYCLKIAAKSFTGSFQIIIATGGMDSDGNYVLDEEDRISFNITSNNQALLFKSVKNIDNPYFCIRLSPDKTISIKEVSLFEAYTKGTDLFPENGQYKYSGRDIYTGNKSQWTEKSGEYVYRALTNLNEIIFETDIVEGDTYAYTKYFIQQIVANGEEVKDTFMMKAYLDEDNFDPSVYSEDDLEVHTNYIDLNKCRYYNSAARSTEPDCSYHSGNQCMYQKYGYCPYLFKTEKHCRKIRTLSGEKSNRFNLSQEVSKVFEVYPNYYIEHEINGNVKKDENGRMIKQLFYMTEKGKENKLGFRYEKNLKDITRTLDSSQIVTKLYVEDVDSDLSSTGLCSIKTAEDNPSRDNYIIDFSYYILKGLLDEETTNNDLYGQNSQDLGFLKQIGYYNQQYDNLTNLIISLQDESYTELQANVEVDMTGIDTAIQEKNKILKKMDKFKDNTNLNLTENDTYNNYKIQYEEQKNILFGLVEESFSTNGSYYDEIFSSSITSAEDFLNKVEQQYGYFNKFKEEIVDKFLYKNFGMVGQYTAEYRQIRDWKKQRAAYLKQINQLSENFYQKYEPFLKEGTWSDENYLSDNAYYFGAKEVAKDGCVPKTTYSISVVDLYSLPEYEDYCFDIADTTYIEDIDLFGINVKTGLPNKLKVIISAFTYEDLDSPMNNTIEVQNYTSQFEDIFEQVSATVQTLSFNENVYKRASNFTSNQNVKGDSLQGALSENDLTLLKTSESNLQLDNNGQAGSDINNHNNKYKLNGQGLFFSNDGGQHWNIGVTPDGINADYIKVGSLDASRVQIVDGNYVYFLWDKSGITAYREPQATAADKTLFSDFTRFNKYGLSLVENNKIRLRAGYEYIGNEGNILEENEITEDNNIGFYLYDKNGHAIFKTENDSDRELTARISLAGEMYVTDTLVMAQGATYSYSYTSGDALTLSLKTFLGTIAYTNEGIFNSTLDGVTFFDYFGSINTGEVNTTDVLIFTIDSTHRGSFSEDAVYISVRITAKQLSDIIINSQYYSYNICDFVITQLNVDQNVVPDTDSVSLALTTDYIENEEYNYYTLNNATNESCYLYKNSSAAAAGNIQANLTAEDIFYLALSGNNYSRTDLTNRYIYHSGEDYIPYNNKVENRGSITPTDNGIALYLNNQSISDSSSTQTAAEEAGYYKRLICCVSKDATAGAPIKNVFSILSSGAMYLGGTVQEYDGTGIPSSLDDYVKIQIDDQTISLVDGTIKIGTDNLAEGIIEVISAQLDEIETQIANSGLITHNHTLGGASVVDTTSLGTNSGAHRVNVDGAYLVREEPTVLSASVLSTEVVLAIKEVQSSLPSWSFVSMDLSTLIKRISLEIAEGEVSGTTGGVAGSTTAGYVVGGE